MGRAGLEPATYGLKGRRTKVTRGLVSSGNVHASGDTKSKGEPGLSSATAQPGEIAIGAHVEVIAGMAAGKVGWVLRPWPRHFERGIALWEVSFPGELISWSLLRADYLRVVP